MKRIDKLLCIFFCLNTINSVYTQDLILDDHPIYDYVNSQLKNSDTISEYNSKQNKLKVTGTIYLSDGKTPASDIILFIEQADENGNFDLRHENNKRYVRHSAQVKTDDDGKYTFYTFVPGNDRRYNQPQQIFPIIKEPSKKAYEINTFLFDEDPLLSKRCKKKIKKKNKVARILKPKVVNGILVAQRDIVLNP